MRPPLRTLALTAHVISSVGWLGAVASFLVLGIAGLLSRDFQIVRSAYLAMNLIGQFIIVPLSLAALVTGLIQSLGTQWGLFRYHWVVVKFTLTIGATVLLLLHQFTAVAAAARRVSETEASALPDVGRLGSQLVVDAGLAVLVLLVTTILSVYKPWGRTSYGRRVHENLGMTPAEARPFGVFWPLSTGAGSTDKIYLLAGLAFLVLIIVLHLTGVIGRH